MTSFRGRLTIVGRVVLLDVTGELSAGLGGQLSGSFVLPQGKYVPPGVYRLELVDGRAGNIDIPKVPRGAVGGGNVDFTVLGTLR